MIAAESAGKAADTWLATHRPATVPSADQADKAASQFGSLGSGSRGIGNQLAQAHIAKAKRLAKEAMLSIEDPDLAWFVQGTAEFDAYVTDMLWAQDYAKANWSQMMVAAIREVLAFLGTGTVTRTVNCHHNFSQRELHDGQGT